MKLKRHGIITPKSPAISVPRPEMPETIGSILNCITKIITINTRKIIYPEQL